MAAPRGLMDAKSAPAKLTTSQPSSATAAGESTFSLDERIKRMEADSFYDDPDRGFIEGLDLLDEAARSPRIATFFRTNPNFLPRIFFKLISYCRMDSKLTDNDVHAVAKVAIGLPTTKGDAKETQTKKTLVPLFNLAIEEGRLSAALTLCERLIHLEPGERDFYTNYENISNHLQKILATNKASAIYDWLLLQSDLQIKITNCVTVINKNAQDPHNWFNLFYYFHLYIKALNKQLNPDPEIIADYIDQYKNLVKQYQAIKPTLTEAINRFDKKDQDLLAFMESAAAIDAFTVAESKGDCRTAVTSTTPLLTTEDKKSEKSDLVPLSRQNKLFDAAMALFKDKKWLHAHDLFMRLDNKVNPDVNFCIGLCILNGAKPNLSDHEKILLAKKHIAITMCMHSLTTRLTEEQKQQGLFALLDYFPKTEKAILSKLKHIKVIKRILALTSLKDADDLFYEYIQELKRASADYTDLTIMVMIWRWLFTTNNNLDERIDHLKTRHATEKHNPLLYLKRMQFYITVIETLEQQPNHGGQQTLNYLNEAIILLDQYHTLFPEMTSELSKLDKTDKDGLTEYFSKEQRENFCKLQRKVLNILRSQTATAAAALDSKSTPVKTIAEPSVIDKILILFRSKKYQETFNLMMQSGISLAEQPDFVFITGLCKLAVPTLTRPSSDKLSDLFGKAMYLCRMESRLTDVEAATVVRVTLDFSFVEPDAKEMQSKDKHLAAFNLAYKQKRYSEAMVHCKTLIKLDPLNMNLHYNYMTLVGYVHSTTHPESILTGEIISWLLARKPGEMDKVIAEKIKEKDKNPTDPRAWLELFFYKHYCLAILKLQPKPDAQIIEAHAHWLGVLLKEYEIAKLKPAMKKAIKNLHEIDRLTLAGFADPRCVLIKNNVVANALPPGSIAVIPDKKTAQSIAKEKKAEETRRKAEGIAMREAEREDLEKRERATKEAADKAAVEKKIKAKKDAAKLKQDKENKEKEEAEKRRERYLEKKKSEQEEKDRQKNKLKLEKRITFLAGEAVDNLLPIALTEVKEEEVARERIKVEQEILIAKQLELQQAEQLRLQQEEAETARQFQFLKEEQSRIQQEEQQKRQYELQQAARFRLQQEQAQEQKRQYELQQAEQFRLQQEQQRQYEWQQAQQYQQQLYLQQQALQYQQQPMPQQTQPYYLPPQPTAQPIAPSYYVIQKPLLATTTAFEHKVLGGLQSRLKSQGVIYGGSVLDRIFGVKDFRDTDVAFSEPLSKIVEKLNLEFKNEFESGEYNLIPSFHRPAQTCTLFYDKMQMDISGDYKLDTPSLFTHCTLSSPMLKLSGEIINLNDFSSDLSNGFITLGKERLNNYKKDPTLIFQAVRYKAKLETLIKARLVNMKTDPDKEEPIDELLNRAEKKLTDIKPSIHPDDLQAIKEALSSLKDEKHCSLILYQLRERLFENNGDQIFLELNTLGVWEALFGKISANNLEWLRGFVRDEKEKPREQLLAAMLVAVVSKEKPVQTIKRYEEIQAACELKIKMHQDADPFFHKLFFKDQSAIMSVIAQINKPAAPMNAEQRAAHIARVSAEILEKQKMPDAKSASVLVAVAAYTNSPLAPQTSTQQTNAPLAAAPVNFTFKANNS